MPTPRFALPYIAQGQAQGTRPTDQHGGRRPKYSAWRRPYRRRSPKPEFKEVSLSDIPAAAITVAPETLTIT